MTKKRSSSRRRWQEAAEYQLELPTVEQVEKAISLKAARWKNRCHEISCKILTAKLVPGVERYGHYYGPVSRKHPYHGRPFQRHGWIETPGGTVVDPTRWCFECVKPYIYHGFGNQYDPGGQRVATDNIKPYPGPHDEADESPNLVDSQRENRRKIIQLAIPLEDLDHLMTLTDGQHENFGFEQVFWLANLPVSYLGVHARGILGALAKAGYKALIPTDNWRMAMEEPVASHLP
jgi:hypothetical protein